MPEEDAPKPVPQIATSLEPAPAPTMAPGEGEAIDNPPPFFDEDDDKEVEKEFTDPFEEKGDKKTGE